VSVLSAGRSRVPLTMHRSSCALALLVSLAVACSGSAGASLAAAPLRGGAATRPQGHVRATAGMHDECRR
jgi:hypothetical protein